MRFDGVGNIDRGATPKECGCSRRLDVIAAVHHSHLSDVRTKELGRPVSQGGYVGASGVRRDVRRGAVKR